MREILFRAKGANDERWFTGSYYCTADTTYCFKEDYSAHPQNTKHYILFDEPTDWGLPNRKLQASIRPETVSQYTGLTDKNGNKIFEGDILEARFDELFPENSTRMKVLFVADERGCGFFSKEPVCDLAELLDVFTARQSEVIGNIYDNPELLEVENNAQNNRD